MLKIYNTLSQQKETFTPLVAGQVSMYVCGMTVYDLCHIGHARVMVAFDVVSRYLRSSGYQVKYIRNITDIDDKIIRRANENGETFENLTERMIGEMWQDAETLGVLPPDEEPRATSHIDGILQMIQELIDLGYAYAVDNGDVYYRVRKFEGYGKLSGKILDELQSGARIQVGELKEDPLDFVLWKAAKPGEPAWKSPWGEGRPGWHIECSVMSRCCLGKTFDIHGGGPDLKFPHHENEIAQSEAANGEKFVNTWMHAGAVRVNNEKMSKSLGNFFTIREVLAQYDPEVVRYLLIGSQYRSPINYSVDALVEARDKLERLYTALRATPIAEQPAKGEWRERFTKAMDDDFNTPEALAGLFELVREINRGKQAGQDVSALAAELIAQGEMLGILQQDPDVFLQGGSNGDESAQIEVLIQQRADAKASKNWADADRIRDQLKEMNVVLDDGPQGTTWRKG
ncbi:cysteine--tRNA ligase [Pelagibaculum spongiae]|uniref:Cysteine--tRNA ligase n=1 Tax=Pelagibaculum spongiae TaxID=2080658 RepID=A0A2V1GZP2_9GAMM|nr:cysteine--tRNA ligase [Pelagibaculum spongiae]PVZ71663.1 cysteine--tRNA ligase [Pelagibaculum spongiae]